MGAARETGSYHLLEPLDQGGMGEVWGRQAPQMFPMTLATGVGEFFGSLGVLTGIYAQWAAWGLVLIMTGAILFNLKWRTQFHTAKQAGWDFNLLLLLMALAVALAGPGAWTLG